MSDYQVISRKFRPQLFKDALGQDSIITTLKNAIKFNKLAHAYLFCGSRGTGKTTLARLLAKAINCEALTEDCEPCNQCKSCKGIMSGSSMDVLEIDGASNRGIDDVRKINETVNYSPTSRYKVYIIDEVHMLTKDAFNALLKTLEEPPVNVKFFFATTEIHKVLPTIVSRCQRFQLSRIPLERIQDKLRRVATELQVTVDEEALRLIAERAEGGMRDAESLFDQILAFEEGTITASSVESTLGLVPRRLYFEIDRAGKAGNFVKAFEITQQLFAEGKDFTYFIEGLIRHLRQLLLFKISGPGFKNALPIQERELVEQSALLYTQEQCLDLIDYLLDSQERLRLSSFGKLTLEAILLHVMRSHFKLPIEVLVRRLSELEKMLQTPSVEVKPIADTPKNAVTETVNFDNNTQALPINLAHNIRNAPPLQALPQASLAVKQEVVKPAFLEKPPVAAPPITENKRVEVNKILAHHPSLEEDPTPSAADLGQKKSQLQSVSNTAQNTPSKPQRPLYEYDTLFHFAAVELEGKVQKN